MSLQMCLKKIPDTRELASAMAILLKVARAPEFLHRSEERQYVAEIKCCYDE